MLQCLALQPRALSEQQRPSIRCDVPLPGDALRVERSKPCGTLELLQLVHELQDDHSVQPVQVSTITCYYILIHAITCIK